MTHLHGDRDRMKLQTHRLAFCEYMHILSLTLTVRTNYCVVGGETQGLYLAIVRSPLRQHIACVCVDDENRA